MNSNSKSNLNSNKEEEKQNKKRKEEKPRSRLGLLGPLTSPAYAWQHQAQQASPTVDITPARPFTSPAATAKPGLHVSFIFFPHRFSSSPCGYESPAIAVSTWRPRVAPRRPIGLRFAPRRPDQQDPAASHPTFTFFLPTKHPMTLCFIPWQSGLG